LVNAKEPINYESILSKETDCIVDIPNGFSLNGDGINDLFKITCMNTYMDVRIIIFNAAGLQVFQKSNFGNVDYWGTVQDAWWDGTDNVRSMGTKLPVGTYFYMLELDKKNKSLIKKATIFISY
jgi:gliding motility-associated-like protein